MQSKLPGAWVKRAADWVWVCVSLPFLLGGGVAVRATQPLSPTPVCRKLPMETEATLHAGVGARGRGAHVKAARS